MRVKPKRSRKTPISSSSTSTAPETTTKSSSSPIPSSSRKRPTSAVSHRLTQTTIAHFHTLLKRQAIYKQSLSRVSTSAQCDEDALSIRASLRAVEAEMEQLGGLKAYQTASIIGQSRERGGDSSKVFIQWLDELGRKQTASENQTKLRLLELGALTPDNYASCSSWIENHPIDLHSQHPSITQQDFFERPLPDSDDQAFDLISCSLVLNFVSSPADRGRMLSLIHRQLKPSPKSLLFLVLPLPCLQNSRYLSVPSFTQLMSILGFKLIKERWKAGGKVGYWLWSWQQPDSLMNSNETLSNRWRRKTIEEDGPKKNNFAVLLPK